MVNKAGKKPRPLDGSSIGPLYNKIKLTIVARISQGEYQAKDRIPSELELVEEFGVSRMTVNRALRELTQEGILLRIPGVGTFVAETQPQSPIVELSDIAQEIKARGHHYACKVVALKEEHCSAGVARSLGLQANERAWHSVLVHSENRIPVVLEDRYVKRGFAPQYLEQDFTAVTPYDYLLSCGPVSEIEHTLNAILPNAKVAKLLQISKTDPCLLLVRRTWSGTETVTFSYFYYPGSRYRLSSRYKLSKYRTRAANR